MNNLNEIIACTLGVNVYDTYEENRDFTVHINSMEEDMDSLEELLKDF